MADKVESPQDAAGVAVFPIAPAAGRAGLEATARAAPMPVPGILLSLGAAPPPPLTYDAAGLLRALGKAAAHITTVPPPQASDADVASLAGVNGDVARSGALNALVGLRAVPANSLRALGGLLDGMDAVDRNLSLRTALTAALERAASGLDPVHTAAAVLNASGGLQALTPRAAIRALAGLRGSNLGLSAAALGINPGNGAFFNSAGSLLLLPASDDTSRSLAGLLAANLDLANARFDASLTAGPAANVGTSLTLSDVLAGDVTLSMAAVNTAFTQGTTTTGAPLPLPLAATPGVMTGAATTAAIVAPAGNPAVAGPTGAAAIPTTLLPGVPTPLPSATPAAALALTPPAPPGAAAVVSFNFFVDAATQAARNIAGNPNYAVMAAALYGNAAIFRATQPDVGAPAAGGGADFPRPVGEATNIRPVRAV